MTFKKYTSIENSYREKYLQQIQIQFPKEKWVVMEKIHGSNFGFWTDGKEVKCQKKSMFIPEDDNFYHYKRVLERYRTNILDYFQNCKDHVNGTIEELTVYGELCGGAYNHPDVDKVQGIKHVQKEIHYSPEIEFFAFDARVNGVYIDTAPFQAMAVISGVPFIPILFEGTLEECLAYSNEYPTTIPGILGLPAIEGNVCEGNVLKPKNTCHFGNGERVMLKNKNAKFSEKGKVKKKKESTPLPEHIVKYVEIIRSYVTENRLKNVLSHIGIPENNKKAFGAILSPFNQDIIKDFVKENPDFQELDKADRKKVTSLANKAAADMVRMNFVNILDGEF